MQNYLLFQAYGNSAVKYECKYALFNLLKYNFYKHIIPVIYTDDDFFFKDVLSLFEGATIEKLDSEKIKNWRGDINFVHRAKIKMLIDFMNKNEGNILYCDTDTYFKKSPKMLFAEIGNGKIFMHQKEGEIDKSRFPVFKKWEAFLVGNNLLSDSSKSSVNKLPMWNAGVIGMSSNHKHVLPQVLDLTDKIYPLFPKHIAEQFSFSYVLSQHFTIYPSEEYIFHYWYLKEFSGYLEKKFSTAESDSLDKIFGQIDKTPEQLLNEKLNYLSKVGRLKFLFKKWQINH
ncbi:MAG: hypothetical protein NVSMB45_01930 [Ginsengibacter sp.]